MEKLEDENVSLDFTVQSLIKECDNVKLEYQKLSNSIKKTWSQTQTEIDELIAHVSKKTYAYGAIRAENQNLLLTISELKTRLANVEKGKSVNTKFDKTNGSQPLLCVTPLNKYVIQKKTDVQKLEENHVVSKPVTLQTSPAKQRRVNSNKNVIAPGIVRRPMNRYSHVKNSILANSKKPAKKVSVYVRKNKQTDNTSENVISNKENIIDVDVANASKAKTLLCVSCRKKFAYNRVANQNLYTISISDMAASSPTLPREKSKKASHPLKLVPMITDPNWNYLHMDIKRTNENSPSTSLIIVDKHEAPPIVTTSDEQTSPISLTEADDFNQENSDDFDGNSQFVSYNPPSHEEIESSTMALEPSNVQNFHQVQPSTNIWTKDHPLDQVIGDPSKPVITRQRLHTDSKVCMYALTVSTIEPKNNKEAMADHSWIESMQDKLNQFERLQEEGIDLESPIAPLLDMRPFVMFYCLILPNKNITIFQMDVKTDFLNGPLKEEVYQSQYAIELLKKHGLDEYVSMSIPMVTERLDADLQGTPTDQTTYRPRPIVKHLKEVKQIFWYLRQSYNMGLWYPKDSGFELIAYSDADHVGCKDGYKSTSGGLQFSRVMKLRELEFKETRLYCDVYC
ncbi:hypothetical protein Tco_0528350 [Tanacetum coccineum]